MPVSVSEAGNGCPGDQKLESVNCHLADSHVDAIVQKKSSIHVADAFFWSQYGMHRFQLRSWLDAHWRGCFIGERSPELFTFVIKHNQRNNKATNSKPLGG